MRVSDCAAERAGGKQGRVGWPVLTPHLCEITPSNSTTALRMYTGGMYICDIRRHTFKYTRRILIGESVTKMLVMSHRCTHVRARGTHLKVIKIA